MLFILNIQPECIEIEKKQLHHLKDREIFFNMSSIQNNYHSLAVVTFVLQHIPKPFQIHVDESPSADRESGIVNPDQSRFLT